MPDDTALDRPMDPHVRSLLKDQLERLHEENFQQSVDEELIHKYIPRDIGEVPVFFPPRVRRTLAEDIRRAEIAERVFRAMAVTSPTTTPTTKENAARAINEELERREVLLRKIGGGWELDYGGKKAFVKNSGFVYIAELMQRPSEVIPVEALAAVVARGMPSDTSGFADVIQSDLHEAQTDQHLLDDRSIREIKDALENLRFMKARALEANDSLRASELDEEIEKHVAFYRPAWDIGGRPRRFADKKEKARTRIIKAVNRALHEARLNHSQEAHDWLNCRIKIGASCLFSKTRLKKA
jgi:hypothetical protein